MYESRRPSTKLGSAMSANEDVVTDRSVRVPARYAHHGYWTTIDQDFRWHVEILPRLTLIAGFEVGTGFYINPTSPEEAAKYLREITV